ncbi:MAG: hypothetical protein ABR548_10540, partial [Actinomycetota bacterium]
MHVARASSWPEADALFRSDRRWLGSDDAYSVPLGPDRILWLFGDTFIGDGSRASAAFVHNSIGIQRGADPSAASIMFRWGLGPDAFFRTGDRSWYWPLHGVRTEEGLLLFMMRVRSPIGGTGTVEEWRRLGSLGFFEVFGWTALLISNPDADPGEWEVGVAEEQEHDIVMGASVVADNGSHLIYGWDHEKRIVLA